MRFSGSTSLLCRVGFVVVVDVKVLQLLAEPIICFDFAPAPEASPARSSSQTYIITLKTV